MLKAELISSLRPYWVEHPLSWQAKGTGIAHFVRNAEPGMFNLAWLALRCVDPPTDPNGFARMEIMMLLGGDRDFRVKGMTLEHLAAVHSLERFTSIVATRRLPQQLRWLHDAAVWASFDRRVGRYAPG